MKLEKTRKLIDEGIDEANPVTALIQVLEAAIELVELPENDFSWSSWEDVEEAKQELVDLIRELERGKIPERDDVAMLFAPTGPLQEVSLSSGWPEEFLSVAAKYDQVEKLIWDPEIVSP